MNSKEWWQSVKKDEKKLVTWLKNQYHGEVTASERIRSLLKARTSDPKTLKILESIALQEEEHASWIRDILIERGIEAKKLDKKERYWEETLPTIKDFISGCAVAARAEAMRLECIEAIAKDPEAPYDISWRFKKILKDERFHAKAFRDLAGEEAFKNAALADERGRNALGLEA